MDVEDPSDISPTASEPIRGGAFPVTAWSMLQQAQGADSESLLGWERLACAYWQPLYAFLRRRGADHDSAADDIQGFFTHILSRDFLRNIEPGTGLFRSFLLTALQNWRCDQHRAGKAQKRGGGIAPISLDALEAVGAMPMAGDISPEEAFDRQWARTVYKNALSTLRDRLASRGREALFLQVRGLLTGQDVAKYQQIATQLQMSEGAIKQAVLEMRREFGAVIRDEIRRTTVEESEVDGEVKYLLELMRK